MLPVPQRSLSTYLVEINKFPLLEVEEERRLATYYRKTGDVEAAHKLVTANLRFVVKVAYEYSSYGVRMSDLIQEGNVGLMYAVKRFDPSKGFRLISYAVWWIRAFIQNFILKTWSLVKIGTTQAQRKLFYKLGQTKRALAKYLNPGEVLTDDTCHLVASQLKVRDEDVMEMEARMKGRDASLDQPIHEESAATSLDFLAGSDNQEELFADEEEKIQVRSQVQKVLASLNEKEKFIVEKRLMTDEPLTLQEIGDRYHISRERARQIEEKTKKKIRLAFADSQLARDYC